MTAAASPDKHIAAARRRVAHLEALAAACDTADARIRDAAEKRLAALEDTIAKARRQALTSPEAAETFQRLIRERARLLAIMERPGGAE